MNFKRLYNLQVYFDKILRAINTWIIWSLWSGPGAAVGHPEQLVYYQKVQEALRYVSSKTFDMFEQKAKIMGLLIAGKYNATGNFLDWHKCVIFLVPKRGLF